MRQGADPGPCHWARSRRCVRKRRFHADRVTNGLNRSLDISFYVLTVDLWDEHAQNEVNLVIHPSSSTAAQPASTVSAYNQAPIGNLHETPSVHQNSSTHYRSSDDSLNGQRQQPNHYTYHFHGYESHGTSLQNANTSQNTSFSNMTLHKDPPHTNDAQLPTLQSIHGQPPNPQYGNGGFGQGQNTGSMQHAPGSFVRNLIGSLVASAFKLKDTNDRLGIWFVLQDLSVRTEGCKIILATVFEEASDENSISIEVQLCQFKHWCSITLDEWISTSIVFGFQQRVQRVFCET